MIFKLLYEKKRNKQTQEIQNSTQEMKNSNKKEIDL